jgi:hypothetical protein
MRSQEGIWAAVLIVLTCSPALAGDHGNGEPRQPHFLRSVEPAGGWNPYGGGFLHWWNAHCFPRWCGPDDYCRKPLPTLCQPPCIKGVRTH